MKDPLLTDYPSFLIIRVFASMTNIKKRMLSTIPVIAGVAVEINWVSFHFKIDTELTYLFYSRQ